METEKECLICNCESKVDCVFSNCNCNTCSCNAIYEGYSDAYNEDIAYKWATGEFKE